MSYGSEYPLATPGNNVASPATAMLSVRVHVQTAILSTRSLAFEVPSSLDSGRERAVVANSYTYNHATARQY
jgi:hypothetical protein